MNKNKNLSSSFKLQKIKILILALAIGLVGTLLSYCYFKDNVNVESNLKITTGTLRCKITTNNNLPININNLTPDKAVDKKLIIKNKGSLNQKILFIFNNFKGTLDNKLLKNLEYNISFTNSKTREKSKSYEGDFYDLYKKALNFKIKNENNSNMILKPGEEFNCEIELELKNDVALKYSKKKISFDINVIATEDNDPNWQ